jgi:putative FmdB family regulatory protein
MPLYEYKCGRCEAVFEVIQKFSDAPLTTHPECGGPVVRLISSPAFQFKGSGWYITDYAKSGRAENGKKEGTGDAKPAASTDTGASKPAESSSTSPAKKD